MRRDQLIAGGLSIALAAVMVLTGAGVYAALAAAALAFALSVYRHHPTAAWVIALTPLVVLLPIPGVAKQFNFMPVEWLSIANALFIGLYCSQRSAVAGGAVVLTATLVGTGLTHGSGVPAVFLIVVPWAAAQVIRQHELVARRLREREQELEGEQYAYADLSVRYERARIASELHDIVAHAISVMVVQASAGQVLVDSEPELAAEVFIAIADAARRAEQDMGQLVSLLSDEPAVGPGSGLALVEELIERAQGTGLDVTLRLEGTLEDVSQTAADGAYRVVREGVTNALRYAAGATVAVLVRVGAGELLVQVTNGPAKADARLDGLSTGNGLRGLRERLDSFGATLEAGATADGGWCVTARMSHRVGSIA